MPTINRCIPVSTPWPYWNTQRQRSTPHPAGTGAAGRWTTSRQRKPSPGPSCATTPTRGLLNPLSRRLHPRRPDTSPSQCRGQRYRSSPGSLSAESERRDCRRRWWTARKSKPCSTPSTVTRSPFSACTVPRRTGRSSSGFSGLTPHGSRLWQPTMANPSPIWRRLMTRACSSVKFLTASSRLPTACGSSHHRETLRSTIPTGFRPRSQTTIWRCCTRASISTVTRCSARTRAKWMVSKVRLLSYGRRMPTTCHWWETSTTGTVAATACACTLNTEYGKFFSRG